MKKERSTLLFHRITIVIGCAALASACATTSTPPPSVPSPPLITTPLPHPTQPAASSTPAAKTVKASSYSPKLTGHETTSGEPYDPNALTAASKTLPLGSVVKVSNPANGRAVKVKINDRGPFVPGRSLDLSHTAAEKLGILHQGVAPVKVQKVAPKASQPDGAKDTGSGGNDSSN